MPRELLFDQLKAVIIEDRRPEDGKLIENPEFLRFAAHWGFRIRACRPYRAQTKGKVERPVGYVRGNFVYGREFLGDGDLAAQAARWLDATANARVHGTTTEVPRIRFERDERARLVPLAAHPSQPVMPLAPRRAAAAVRPFEVPVEHRPLGGRQVVRDGGVGEPGGGVGQARRARDGQQAGPPGGRAGARAASACAGWAGATRWR